MANQKISSFTSQSILTGTDLFTLVRNNTNVNISFADFKSSLGVTGTLNSVGDPLGVPVYQSPAAGVNNIRSIESSKGVMASVSAQNGINLACNFSQPTGGFSVIENLNSDIYKFRGVKGISPIEVNLVDDFLEFSQSSSPLAQTNTVIVSDMSDFPVAVGGVITLEDETNYIIVQPLTTANRFVCGTNNHITANNPFSPLFTYTGSGTFFSGVDVNFLATFIPLHAPSGTMFDFRSTASGNTLGLDTVTIIGCGTLAVLDDLRSFNATNVGVFSADNGITVTGTTNWQVFSSTKVRLESTSSSFVGYDFTNSIHKTLEIIDPIIKAPASAIGISGLISSGNITSGEVAAVSNGEFSGGLTPLQNISESDVRWDFQGNSGIPDSISDGLIWVEGSSTQTVISSTSTPTKVTNTWTNEYTSRFNFDSNGRLTYTGEKNARLPIDLTSTMLTVAGGGKQGSMCIAINGSVISPTCKQATISSSKAASVTTIWQHDFTTGDYVEVFVSNESDTTNIIVQQVILRIN